MTTTSIDSFFNTINLNEIEVAIDLANTAFALIGKCPIDGFNMWGSYNAMLAYNKYHPIRRRVLCDKLWPELIKSEKIKVNENRFYLPNDTLRIAKIMPEVKWHMSGFGYRTIVIDSDQIDEVELQYIPDEENLQKYSEHLKKAFIIKLASSFCDSEDEYEMLDAYYKKLVE